MAVQFDYNSTDRLSRTSALPAFNTFTICCWQRRVGTGTDGYWRVVFSLEDSTSSASNQIFLSYQITTNQLNINNSEFFSTTPAEGDWHFVAMTCAGSGTDQCKGYLYTIGSGFESISDTHTSFTPAIVCFGGDSYSNESGDADLFAMKIWNRVLSQAELENEVWSIFPKSLDSLYFFNPGFNNTDVTTDWTGNGNLTLRGTLDNVDNPPIGWGANRVRIGVPSSAVAYNIDAASGSYALSGSTDNFGFGLNALTSTYPISGVANQFLSHYIESINTSAYSISGNGTSLLSGYLENINTASYGIVGNDINLNIGDSINPGSYAKTGNDMGLVSAYLESLNTSTYDLSGSDASLISAYLESINSGSYLLSGSNNNFGLGDNLSSGVYLINGSDAEVSQLLLVLETGSYLITGDAASFIAGYVENAQAGSYPLSGNDTTFISSYLESLNTGLYLITGNDLSLIAGYLESLNTGVYSQSGSNINFIIGINIQTGIYSISGVDVTFFFSGTALELIAEIGAYLLSGSNLHLRIGLTGSTTSYSISGPASQFGFGLNHPPGSYNKSGTDLTLLAHYLESLNVGSHSISGQNLFNIIGLLANPGSIILTGDDVSAIAAYLENLGTSSYPYTGQDSIIVRAVPFNAESGVISISGVDLINLAHYLESINLGSYLISGNDAVFGFSSLFIPDLIRMANLVAKYGGAGSISAKKSGIGNTTAEY